MSKRYNDFMHKLLMYMGIVMLYITIVHIVPVELNYSLGTGTIIAFSIVYIPLACWCFNYTFQK